jgi:thiamine-phosphate pyrophosphorylase
MPAPLSPVICLVTDRWRLAPPAPGFGAGDRQDEARVEALARLVADAAAAGVSIVQVRERGLSDRQLLAVTSRLVASAPGTRIVVNDRVDVALAANAAGVHLRGDSMPAHRVRALAPAGFLIGQSVHSAAEARAAADGGADYLIMGTIYRTPSKPPEAPIVGLEGLADACRAVSLPVLAIGGVGADNLRDVAAAGAAGFAAIGWFVRAAQEGGAAGLRAALGAAAAAFATVQDGA